MTHEVAVLMTCHNRRATTLRCLEQLKAQELPDGWSVRAYVVDDGSTDGTTDAIATQHPDAVLLGGSGDLYWTGGMLSADAAAIVDGPDYLLWLNDDVGLSTDAIKMLVETAQRTDNTAIVVGATADPDSGTVTYGGHRRTGRPLDLELMEPNGAIQCADTMNGNVVLIPAAVRTQLGPLDARLRHNMADMDYAYRARKASIAVVIAPRLAGTCKQNSKTQRWNDSAVPVRERIRVVMSPTGVPVTDWMRFTRRHTGWWWPRYFIGPYARTILGGKPTR